MVFILSPLLYTKKKGAARLWTFQGSLQTQSVGQGGRHRAVVHSPRTHSLGQYPARVSISVYSRQASLTSRQV